ncbi:uncharacterized protein LOC142225190 [Haematobia irritans]|uniref:uncharacterized protein LOC142225190 n=1 Tax=Haematobia irritans TaxID=7368 RepID=UPI003F505D7D
MYFRLPKEPVTSTLFGVTIKLTAASSLPLVNNSWDACAFLKNRKRYGALGRIFKFIAPYTNVNHSCPYNHDIIVKNFSLTGRPIMPLINGIYTINTFFILNGAKRLTVDFDVKFEN